MNKLMNSALLMIFFVTTLNAQLPPAARITGNSLVQFAPWPVEGISLTEIRGHNGYTCALLAQMLPFDVPLGTQTTVLVESTNDVRTGVPVEQHMACIEGEIAFLQSYRPGIRIIVVNTPPWNEINCYGDTRTLIAQYNSAYLSLPAQYGVTLVDVWTGAAQSDGWAVPELMSGPCGIHPGAFQIPNPGWYFFMGQIVSALRMR